VSPLTPIENRRFNYRRRLISIDTAIASRHFQNIRFMLNVITRLFNLRPTQLHSLSGCARATYRAECKPRAPSMCAFFRRFLSIRRYGGNSSMSRSDRTKRTYLKSARFLIVAIEVHVGSFAGRGTSSAAAATYDRN